MPCDKDRGSRCYGGISRMYPGPVDVWQTIMMALSITPSLIPGPVLCHP